MVVQTRGTVGTAAGTNIESGSGGAHTADTGTESTQEHKPTSSLIKHLINTMLLVVLFSSTVENAYAYDKMLMFMLVSITSFLWIKACCKMAGSSTELSPRHAQPRSPTPGHAAAAGPHCRCKCTISTRLQQLQGTCCYRSYHP